MTEKSKITKRMAGGKFAPGTSGNPNGRPPGKASAIREMTKAFADKYGEEMLELLRGHAFNRPEIALALADRLFGSSDWSGHGVGSMIGPLETVDDCDEARDRILSAYARGDIGLDQCERLETLVSAKKLRLVEAVTIEPKGDIEPIPADFCN